jgi:Icc-related predicted phosphoesterase
MTQIKIDCISDLHGSFPILYGGDLLIIAGDITAMDMTHQWAKFYDWVRGLQYRKIILIAGNHDEFLSQSITSEESRKLYKEFQDPNFLSDIPNLEYLCDNGTEFAGLKIWGSPWTPTFGEWHFMKDRGKPIREMWDKIPLDTNILITHGPPFGTLDKALHRYGLKGEDDTYTFQGCEDLSDKILELKELKLHVFGHIHESYGKCYRAQEQTPEGIINTGHLSVNAAIMNREYQPLNEPITVYLDIE